MDRVFPPPIADHNNHIYGYIIYVLFNNNKYTYCFHTKNDTYYELNKDRYSNIYVMEIF